MRNFVVGFLVAILVLPLGWAAYFAFGLTEVRADATPSALETSILQTAVRASVKRAAAEIPNPPSASDDTLVAGGKLYVAGCAGCHGALEGPYREDRSHFPPVPQLRRVGPQYSEPELYWIVKHGIRMTAMSAYGPFYSEKKLWALAAFLHRINNLPPGVVENLRPKKK
jgi:mono/diheme cytochrome c family protein